jgi:hypothetical protein
MRNQFIKFNLFILVILTSGCGNVFYAGGMDTPDGSPFKPTALTAAEKRNLEYDCSNRTMAIPVNDNLTDGTDHFEVCPSIQRNNYTDLELKGKTANSNTVCIVPAFGGASGRFIPDNANDGTPSAICAESDPTDGNFYFSVPANLAQPQGASGGVYFNAFYFAEKPFVQQLETCLMANMSECPIYGVVRFR